MNYRLVYLQIIKNAKCQELLGLRKKDNGIYYEKHHILPKSLFPLWSSKKSNIVLLTAREHFFVHQLLTKIYPCYHMFKALSMFCKFKQSERNLSSRQYEECRKAASEANKLYWKSNREYILNRIHESLVYKSYNYFTEEYRQQMSLERKGKKWYNDGVKEYFTRTPEPSWSLGRLKCSVEKRQDITDKLRHTIQSKSLAEKEQEKKNRSEANKRRVHKKRGCTNKHWFNNGVENVLAEQCPKGYVSGKIVNIKLKQVICLETNQVFFAKDLPGVHKTCNSQRKSYKGKHYAWFNGDTIDENNCCT